MKKILIIEDEMHLANGLRFNLEAEGFAAEVAGDGESGLEILGDRRGKFDAVILDIMLPGIKGFDVAKQLRKAGDFTPILMLTARGRPEDVLAGFESGADDYIPKPFDLSIFLARLRGLLRRSGWQAAELRETKPDPEVIDVNGRQIDLKNLEIRFGEDITRLTLMEADLLRYLVKNRGEAVSRKSILEDVWGLHEDTDTRAIDNFIVRLRRYLEDDSAKPLILETIRGLGYRFNADG